MKNYEPQDRIEVTLLEVDGNAVWIGHRPGTGERVLLLHGGLSDSRVWAGILSELLAELDIWMYDRQGHGHTADTPRRIDYDGMLSEAAAVLTHLGGSPLHIVGHSDGANLGLLLAIGHPRLVRSLVMFSGNSAPDGVDLAGLDMSEIQASVEPAYASISDNALGQLPGVVEKIELMWKTEPNISTIDMSGITLPVLVACSDDDWVFLEHSVALFRSIPDAQFTVMPDATHMGVFEKPKNCAFLIQQFLASQAIEKPEKA